MNDYRPLLIPIDFSAHARAALDAAADLARRLRADLHLVHIVQPPIYGYGFVGEATPTGLDMQEIRKGVEAKLQEYAASVADFPGKVSTHVVEGGRIASDISDLARELDAGMIVMGTHGRTGLAHAFLGSVAERTLREAPCPVLTVQAPDEDAN